MTSRFADARAGQGAASPPMRFALFRLLPALLLAKAAAAAAPPLTAERYRASVAPITSCAALAGGWQALPDARPLLRSLFDADLPVKRAAESDGAFLDRAVAQLFRQLGDPSRLYLRVNLAGATRYDARRRALIVRLPNPFEAVLDRWGRAEHRIRGATPLVTETELRASLAFPDGAIPAQIVLPMSPEDADQFATAGRLHLLAVFEDFGTEASHRAASTPGAPAVQTSYKLVRLQPKCAFVTNATKPVAGWSFDEWSRAAPPG